MKEGRPAGRPHATDVAGVNTDGRQTVQPHVASRGKFGRRVYIPTSMIMRVFQALKQHQHKSRGTKMRKEALI
jgi:hypothetical protein